MKTKTYLAVIVFSIIGLVSGFAQTTATNFRMPFSGTLTQTQNHFLWEPFTLNGQNVAGFHAGEDWSDSGRIGENLRAIADGKVVTVGNDSSFGRYVRVRYDMPYGQSLYSDYVHCNSVFVSNNKYVKKGDVIATLGGTGVGTAPHLHWSMARSSSVGPLVNPYYGGKKENGTTRLSLSPSIGLDYVSPSLVVSDWKNQKTVQCSPNILANFTVNNLITSWMIYILDSSGNVVTLSDAVSKGIIYYGILRKDGSKWLYFKNQDHAYVMRGEEYAIFAKERCKIVICEPSFDIASIRDRAMQDMFSVAKSMQYRHVADGTNIYKYNSTNTAHHHAGVFVNQTSGVSVLYQLTHVDFPLVRMVFPYHLVNGSLVKSGDPYPIDHREPSY